jgi:chloride channel 7
MTLSLTVIVTEATGDISLGLPIMFAIMAAKLCGDLFNEGIFDMHIQLAGTPLLEWEPPPMTSHITAQEVMSHPVVVLREDETVERIYHILSNCKHNGFPIVSNEFDPTVRIV